MVGLLDEVASEYDAILIDGPPLAIGVDALVLGKLAAAMLVVCRPGETNRKSLAVELAKLDRMSIRVLGAVLNDVPTQGLAESSTGRREVSYEALGEAPDEKARPESGERASSLGEASESRLESYRAHQRRVQVRRWI